MSYNVNVQTIVVDVDDTISTHTNRDYPNAIPDQRMITKLNAMYNEGWDIVYYTARGQVSCKGDIDLIEERNRTVLETWMKRNNVLYTKIVFGKPMGFYYIDDKAMRPDEFLNSSFENLKGGSGAEIKRIGLRVSKTHPTKDLSNQVKWYKQAKDFSGGRYRLPEVYNFFGNTIDMEYIEGQKLNKPSHYDIERIVGILKAFSNVKGDVSKNVHSFEKTMIPHVKKHIEENKIPYADRVLAILENKNLIQKMNAYKTFSHGDFTLDNMILDSNNNIALIDPNYDDEKYSSFIMDVGKLFQSYHTFYEEIFMNSDPTGIKHKEETMPYLKEMLTNMFGKSGNIILLGYIAEMIHYIRMVKYKENQEDKEVIFSIIYILVEKIENHLNWKAWNYEP